MFFRRRKRKPLKMAVLHMQAATRILHRHWSDSRYDPAEADLAELRSMEQVLFRLAATAGGLAIRLERRFRGEPENDQAKWRGRER